MVPLDVPRQLYDSKDNCPLQTVRRCVHVVTFERSLWRHSLLRQEGFPWRKFSRAFVLGAMGTDADVIKGRRLACVRQQPSQWFVYGSVSVETTATTAQCLEREDDHPSSYGGLT